MLSAEIMFKGSLITGNVLRAQFLQLRKILVRYMDISPTPVNIHLRNYTISNINIVLQSYRNIPDLVEERFHRYIHLSLYKEKVSRASTNILGGIVLFFGKSQVNVSPFLGRELERT